MSQTGLEVFDKSMQTTNIWLKEIMEDLGPDRQVAYHVLSAVLHTLRDRLTADEAAHLGQQLPLIVRGLYYDAWHPTRTPNKARTEREFLAMIERELAGKIRPVDVREAAQAVFRVLREHVSAGEIDNVRNSLPKEVQALWH